MWSADLMYFFKCSHCQFHDSVYDVIRIVFKCFDSLGLGDIGLGHDQLHVLLLHTRGVDFLTILLLLRDSGRPSSAPCAHLGRLWRLSSLELLGGPICACWDRSSPC